MATTDTLSPRQFAKQSTYEVIAQGDPNLDPSTYHVLGRNSKEAGRSMAYHIARGVVPRGTVRGRPATAGGSKR